MIQALQYFGSALALIGAWLVSSTDSITRARGFVIWILSNTALLIWALNHQFWGMAAMYSIFFLTSARGFINSVPDKP